MFCYIRRFDAESASSYKLTGDLHEQERDVAKFWKDGKIRICLYGFENQTKIDPYMPLRIINYDGANYRAQIGQKHKPYPVVTIVLYFGERGSKKRGRQLINFVWQNFE